MSRLVCQLLSILIIVLSLLMTSDSSKEFLPYLYSGQLLVLYIYLFRFKYLYSYFTFTMLFISYLDLSMALGGYAFNNEQVMPKINYEYYLDWENTDFITTFILLVNLILFNIEDIFFRKKYQDSFNKKKVVRINPTMVNVSIVLLSSFILLFYFIPLDVALLGGSGDVSIVPMSIAALMVIYLLIFYEYKFAIIISIGIVIFFASFSFDNKREAVFLIFPIIMMYAILMKLKINKKILLLYTPLLLALLILFILVMSITRAGWDSESIWMSFSFIENYLSDDLLWAYFYQDIEVSYMFFHTYQSIEYILADSSLLTYGATFFKFLFLFIPLDIIEKPASFVHLYTTHLDSAYRSSGGSWAPNLISEFFWNFHVFGIVAISAIFFWINRLYYILHKSIITGVVTFKPWYLYSVTLLVSFYRGSGSNLFFFYLVIGVFFSLFLQYWVKSVLFSGAKRNRL